MAKLSCEMSHANVNNYCCFFCIRLLSSKMITAVYNMIYLLQKDIRQLQYHLNVKFFAISRHLNNTEIA